MGGPPHLTWSNFQKDIPLNTMTAAAAAADVVLA